MCYQKGIYGFKCVPKKANKWLDRVETRPIHKFGFEEDDDDDDTKRLISETKLKAEQGDVDQMVILARWYLFGEQDGVDLDLSEGYFWSKKAGDEDSMTGKAYQGFCLVRGLGVERDWEDGYELLIEAANQDLDTAGRGKQMY